MEEIQNIVLDMKNNSAPGPNDIPIEFFKAFFSKFGFHLIIKMILQLFTTLIVLNIYFHYLKKSELVIFPEEWNSASIISIPKKKKKENF